VKSYFISVFKLRYKDLDFPTSSLMDDLFNTFKSRNIKRKLYECSCSFSSTLFHSAWDNIRYSHLANNKKQFPTGRRLQLLCSSLWYYTTQ